MNDDTQAQASAHGDNPGWRFCLPVEVRFADIDMFLHLNNAKYLTYIESARVAYYTAVSGMTNPREFNMTVARAEIDFIKPAFYGQTVNVFTRAGRIGNKSWTLEHELRDAATGDLLARASTVLVYFNHETGGSAQIPPEIVELVERFEGRGLKRGSKA